MYETQTDGNYMVGSGLDMIDTIEFDGTTVLCRVCGDKASGFHYGVHSCEGCKGFFRRSIQQKIQYRPCTKNQQCTIQRVNRNRCQYCRLKKCIAVGMSRDAVRFGRVPKREKARIFAAMQSVNASRCVANNVVHELDDETRVTKCVVQSYMESCEYTQDRIHVLYEQARRLPVYEHCSQYESCPLSPRAVNVSHDSAQKEFGEHFSSSIRGVIEFSRRLPGFSHLPHEDQVTLLKSSAFEALLVRLAALFNIQEDSLLTMNGRLVKRTAVFTASNSKFLMDSMCDFADRLNRLGLTDPELGLFSAVIVMSSDRPGIRNRDLVERMHIKYASFLQNMLIKNHPSQPSLYRDLLSYIPDLRTLNTLHSDKLMRQRRPTEHAQSTHWDEPRSMWDEKDGNMSSPTSSCNTDESMRSPESYSESMYGECVSSEGSVCGSEVAGYLDPRPVYVQHRRRCDNSEGTSSGDEMTEMTKCPYSKRKVDSPEDSGIESDKISLPSICSSPRSSIDEKSEEDREEDMPVLRRALQAPPILNNDIRMDETYKRHKKFRALRREEEPHSSQTLMPSPSRSILEQTLVQPISHISIQSSSASSSSPSLRASVLSSPSLAKTLSEQPKMSEISLRKADLLHAIMVKNETTQRNQRAQHQQSPRVSPAPLYVPTSCMERLHVSPNSSWTSSPAHPESSSQQPIISQPRLHLLTTPTPSRYYEPRISASSTSNCSSSPSRHSPSFHTQTSHSSHRLSPSPLVELTVDIADSQQPLNLSTKTPPPQEFMVEA